MCIFIVTQNPFLLMTSLEDESNVKVKVNLEQGEIDSLQSELLIKTQLVMKMKGAEQRLAQSKLVINKIERKLSSGIEMLTSSQSKLCSKLDTIEMKVNKSIEMLSSLQPKLLNFEKQLNSDVKVLAAAQLQPHLLSQVMEMTSEKEKLDAHFKDISK